MHIAAKHAVEAVRDVTGAEEEALTAALKTWQSIMNHVLDGPNDEGMPPPS